jgi:putative ABC transport system ATP-binding protein
MRVFHHRRKKLEMLGETVVECRGLSKSYNLKGGGEPVRALSDITLASGTAHQPIKRGEFAVIRGPSGGGKTTFLNLVGTIDVASTGVVSKTLSTQKFRMR